MNAEKYNHRLRAQKTTQQKSAIYFKAILNKVTSGKKKQKNICSSFLLSLSHTHTHRPIVLSGVGTPAPLNASTETVAADLDDDDDDI